MNTIPTLTDLYTGIISDYNAQFGININPFGKAFLKAKAMATAAKYKLIYLGIGNVQKNIFVDTADPESLGGTLERFGRVKINRNPYPAVAAQYKVQITGTIGSIIPAQTTFKSDDASLSPNMMFILDNAYTLVSNPDTIILRALTPGTISELNLSDTLTATSPLPTSENQVSVIAYQLSPYILAVVQPLDAEGIEAYRKVVIDSYRLSPQGGSPVDYILWSEDVDGVDGVYPYAAPYNEINVYIESIISDSIDGKGTPSSSMLTAVSAAIEMNPDTTLPLLERGRRPLGTWQVNTLPVTPKDVVITITGYQGITTDIQTKIANSIQTLITGIRPFIDGAGNINERNDLLNNNKIGLAIVSAVPNSIFLSTSFTVSGVSYTLYQFANAEIPFINTSTSIIYA